MADTKVTQPEDWVEEFGDYLYRYALLRLRDDAAASDVVQDTFLAGIKNFKSYNGKAPVKYWLRGILRNKIVDYIRKNSKEDAVEDVGDSDFQDTLMFKAFGVPTMRPAPWQFDAYRSFEKNEFWRVFRHCLEGLSGNMQKAVTLKMLEGMSTEEVCKIINVQPNNLWVILHRARNQLKTCLEDNWDKAAES